VPPNRDLWPAIAASIAADRVPDRPAAAPWRVRFAAGLAASVALVGLGFFVGRGLPVPDAPTTVTGRASAASAIIDAEFEADPKLRAARGQLLAEAERKLAELPDADRERVAASLATIRRAMSEIEASLGRDPANALLQELLVNAYQEEMRVLTALSAARQET
jgi:hypothetical protein